MDYSGMDFEELLYGLDYGYMDPNAMAAMGIVSTISSLISLAVGVLMIIAMWKIFTKAGEAGWKAIIPIYNMYIMFKIAWSRKWFWVYLALTAIIVVLGGIMTWDIIVYATGMAAIPEDTFLLVIGGLGVGMLVLSIPLMVVTIMLYWKMAKAFGQGVGFFFGLLFLSIIFYCILAFGKAQYVGPNGNGAGAAVGAAAGMGAAGAAMPAYTGYPAGYPNTYGAPVSYTPQGMPQSTYAPVQEGYAPQAQAPAPVSAPQANPYAPQSVYAPSAGTYVPAAPSAAPAATPSAQQIPIDLS